MKFIVVKLCYRMKISWVDFQWSEDFIFELPPKNSMKNVSIQNLDIVEKNEIIQIFL